MLNKIRKSCHLTKEEAVDLGKWLPVLIKVLIQAQKSCHHVFGTTCCCCFLWGFPAVATFELKEKLSFSSFFLRNCLVELITKCGAAAVNLPDWTTQCNLLCIAYFFCEHSCEIPLPPNHPFHFNFPIACLHFVPPRHYLGFFLETQHFINTPTHRHRQIHSYTQVEQINWIYSHYNLHKFCMSLTYANAICCVCVAEFLLIYLL